ncbi:MAG: glutamate synthase large subunit, partial [Actinomycetota bacterium]|nr:glutamate synthase large subunit [Actinomycetota bacterium]
MSSTKDNSSRPAPERPPGLVRPEDGHDGCGVACVARLDAVPIHEVIERGLTALDRLEHRGASGSDENSGDGAGIMIGLPHAFLRSRAGEFGISAGEFPEPGLTGVAMTFLPREVKRADELAARIDEIVEAEGQRPLGWRQVDVEPKVPGALARPTSPRIRQLLIAPGPEVPDQDEFENRLYLIRRVAEKELEGEVSFPSLSSRTIVYKGLLTAPQLSRFYPDLRNPELVSTFAIVHSRFSTNTAPSWELAHPLRMIAHNGEINTVLGNINWMRARESALAWDELGPDFERCLPLINRGASDSAAFDRALELLFKAGRSLPHALMMMIPMAYENRQLPDELRDFYAFHSLLLEPWDGPASIMFSDGRLLGATLDRNGLRPSRWSVTDDGWLALSSEAGTFSAEPSTVVRRGRLQAGHLLLVDLEQGRIYDDREAEMEVARQSPYGEWFRNGVVSFNDLPEPEMPSREEKSLTALQLAFGYSQEDLRVLLAPTARDAKEPTGSMGNDVALAVLSDKEPSLFSYFKQRFAQVTNPAIDSVREHIVMSLTTAIGPQGNLLDEDPEHAQQVLLGRPIVTDPELEKLRQIEHPVLRAETIDISWQLTEGETGMEAAVERICGEASEAVAAGATLLVLSDRQVNPERVPIPSLLATSAVNHHLIREGTRLQAALIVESGEPREVHHLAALIGYGASAINPYLLLDSLDEMQGRAALENGLTPEDAVERTIVGLSKGMLKTMSKIGISSISSYRGAQIFEAVGLDREMVDRHFSGTPSRLSGIGLDELAGEALERHARAYPEQHGLPLPRFVEEGALAAAHEKLLPQGGVYQWRRDGEFHMWEPATVASLQRAAREAQADGSATAGSNGAGDAPKPSYAEFSSLVNDENASRGLLRGLLRLREPGKRAELEAVEPSKDILRRFSTGAMSLGALSREAHETLAIAMNRIGGMSNSGEGGEDKARNALDPNGDSRRSRIRQIASGRFGVDVDFLSHADQIQIKIAQGAKPGEGGQLPGPKVDDYIADLRYATPGVELISPPPHHDIYSIEDLKQLIYDLRTANPEAWVSVKLASESGVGTIAAGVAKCGADHIVIAGHDGGTGASPLSSLKHAGLPWELGLAETQQVLVQNELRDRIRVQVDGGLRTGRDVAVAALLGAEEFGMATASLIA